MYKPEHYSLACIEPNSVTHKKQRVNQFDYHYCHVISPYYTADKSHPEHRTQIQESKAKDRVLFSSTGNIQGQRRENQ